MNIELCVDVDLFCLYLVVCRMQCSLRTILIGFFPWPTNTIIYYCYYYYYYYYYYTFFCQETAPSAWHLPAPATRRSEKSARKFTVHWAAISSLSRGRKTVPGRARRFFLYRTGALWRSVPEPLAGAVMPSALGLITGLFVTVKPTQIDPSNARRIRRKQYRSKLACIIARCRSQTWFADERSYICVL